MNQNLKTPLDGLLFMIKKELDKINPQEGPAVELKKNLLAQVEAMQLWRELEEEYFIATGGVEYNNTQVLHA